MLRRIFKVLEDIIDLYTRADISPGEKVRILLSYVSLKLQKGEPFRFLGYRIAGASRANTVGILKEVFMKGDYAFSPQGKVSRIFDVGGNIGIATLFFKRYFPDAQVSVFEASNKNFKFLKENVESNRLTNVMLVHGALGKEVGVREFYFNPKNPGGSTGNVGVVESKTASSFEREEVPALKLSAYLKETIDLLKLDVEGAEGEILSELEEEGKLHLVSEIVMEYHANAANPSNDLPQMLGLLERSGFSVVIYDNEHGEYGKRLKPTPFYHFMIRAYKRKT